MDVNLGERIKALRLERNLSIDLLVWDMNKKYGLTISKGTISRWENNLTEPSLNLARAYADYFNVSLDYLIGLTNDRTPVRMLTYYKENKNKQSKPKPMDIESYAARDITLLQAYRFYKRYLNSPDIIRSKIDFLLDSGSTKKEFKVPLNELKRLNLSIPKSPPKLDYLDITKFAGKEVVKSDN